MYLDACGFAWTIMLASEDNVTILTLADNENGRQQQFLGGRRGP